ncbi:MAG: hypothetical protein P8H17_04020 [Flavobacteriales bacterium]|nr:hypothetical protein [Flavobacteriales bacterium]
MNEISLYEYEKVKTEGVNGFTSLDIFSEGGTDEVWGHKDKLCNPFSFSVLDSSINYNKNKLENSQSKTDNDDLSLNIDIKEVVVFEKKSVKKNSIHIKTDMDPHCEWIGMGIGWDGWQGKDISTIVDNAAIEFMARVDGSPIYNIPIVFILEDYGANQCYTTANYLGIDGGEITNNWTKVIVPLSTFSYQTHNIDLTNIKQLMMQCYAKVDIYIDNIRIIPHVHKYKRMNPNLIVKDSVLPIDIFSENLKSSFGINEKYCKNIILNSEESYDDGNYLDIDVNEEECKWNQLGVSWADWLYSDLSGNIYGVYLEFDVKVYNNSETRIIFEDYNGNKISLDMETYINENKLQEWQKIRISMRHFPIRKSNINLKKIKSLVFDFGDKTKLKIDNIKLDN